MRLLGWPAAMASGVALSQALGSSMDVVTRNHRHPSMKALMDAVPRCMEVCQPSPGSARALANA